MINAIFFMEQHIGHRTYYENLRPFVDAHPELKASWVEVNYQDESSIWMRLPLLPKGLQGTLIGREQVRNGFGQASADISIFNTQVPAALTIGLVRTRPYILCTDITPVQYDRMAERYGHKPDGNGIVSRYKHRVNVRLFQEAARVLPWSNWTAESLEHEYGVDPDRIEVFPPGVDLEKWHPGDGSENDPVRILFVGGDFYRKGGGLLLQAFKQLPGNSAELVLVTRSTVEPLAGVTVFAGLKPNTAELLDLYRSCDIFVLPTDAEAFGIAAVEASASGLPVIATSVGGLVDIVVEGETGFLIPGGDEDALAARLKLLIEDKALRMKLGKAARMRVQNQFNARKNAVRMVEIIKMIVE